MQRSGGITPIFWIVNCFVCVFLLGPIIVVIIASFSDDPYLVFPPSALSLRWYAYFFSRREFTDSLLLSLRLGALATCVSVGVGVMAALELARARFRGAEIARSVFMAPLLVPGIMLGIAMLIYLSNLRMNGTFVGLMFAHVVLQLPFVIRIVSAGLQSIDSAAEDAALSLGASRAWAIVSVTLPMIRGSVFAASIFAFMTSFDEVIVSLFLSGPRITTLPVRIFQYIEYTTDPSIAAISSIIIFLTGGVVVLLDRLTGFTRLI